VSSKAPYRGINILSLFCSAQKQGFDNGLWGTYKQWAELGAQVRKGERGTPVVFWKVEEKEVEEAGPEEAKPRRIFIAKGYTVFNASQVEGFTLPKTPGLSPAERNALAEDFLHGLGADVRHGYTQAAFEPRNDFIKMPDYERFKSGAAYYSTLAHEIT